MSVDEWHRMEKKRYYAKKIESIIIFIGLIAIFGYLFCILFK